MLSFLHLAVITVLDVNEQFMLTAICFFPEDGICSFTGSNVYSIKLVNKNKENFMLYLIFLCHSDFWFS